MTHAAEWTSVDPPDAAQVAGSLDFLAIAWQRKWIAVCVTVVALGLGYLYFLRATPVYQSKAQILLIKKKADLPVAGPEGQVNYEDHLSTHMILIRSPLIVGKAVQEHGLGSLPSLKGVGNPTAAIIGGLRATRGGDRDALDPNVIDLAYKGLDAEDCGTVLTAIVRSYQDFLGETYQDFSKETVELISKAKDELDKQLTEKEAAYREFRQESPLLWRGEKGGNLHEARMAEIETTRSEILVENSQTKAQIEAIEAAREEGGNREALALLASDNLPGSRGASQNARYELEERIFQILLEEQMLLEDYGAEHPKVKAIRKKMQLMREHLGTMPLGEGEDDAPVDFLTVYVESLRQQVKVGEERLAELDRLFEQERNAAKALSSFQVEDEMYRNEIARTQQLFDGVVKRLEEMNLIQDYGGMSTQLISPPGTGSLVRPKLTLVLAVAGLIGVFAGVGLGYLAELADKSFRSPEDVRRQLGLPLVGHIPVIESARTKTTRRGKKPERPGLTPVLCTYHRPKSRQAEAYRAVRTSLYYSAHGQGHKVIQVTSPNPGDGKTTLASNLAVSIANSGKRVLLVDADLRRPRVHSYFGLDNAKGLSNLISNGGTMSEASQQTAVRNLWAMPCGPKPHNPADLVTSPRIKDLLDEMREQYEFVIVDSPPLLAVTDPSVIASRVDGVLLVIRLGKNARGAAVRSTEILRSLGAEMLGIVVNGVGKKAGYGGYYRYGGYRYGGYHYGRYRYGGRRYGYGYDYGYGSEGHGGNGDDLYYSDGHSDEKTAGISADRVGGKQTSTAWTTPLSDG